MLTVEEYGTIKDSLEREPNEAEIAVFEAMWSEHCSYKSSKRWFHLFNTEAPYLELGIGEGAGLIDIGDGFLVGLGLESHNHPSAISPYDGAATGVGGIIRDILSQGCRPVALLDSIRFGELESKRSQHLFENVVRGISFYGNCCGIPTLGGEVEFAQPFEENCLVNAMCVGVIDKKKVVRSIASKPGSFLVLYGSSTGRDGIHGVSFASKDLSDKSEKDRPAVQIGDPLMEKILIDATLELVEEELLAGLQDLGGGGLSCGVTEMCSRGGTGAIIRLEDIPLRAKNMEPWEILVSESQERMLAIVDSEKLSKVCEILDKYDLQSSVIGEVTDNSHYIAFFEGNKVVELPVDLVVEGCPEPERLLEIPDYVSDEISYTVPISPNIKEEILKLLSSPNIGDKSWVYQQYDQHVQTQTVIAAGSDSAVLKLENEKYIALSLDCNSFMTYLDPFNGTANNAAEAMRNLVCVGAKPLAIVDCLNFGNPENPDSYWQFVEAVKGLGQFSKDFSLPIVGGNVSFYNESSIAGKKDRINPSPTIGMIGIIEEPNQLIKNSFQSEDSIIISIGFNDGNLNGSEYLRYNHGKIEGKISTYDFDKEMKSRQIIEKLNNEKLILSCHDISNGGLITSLIEMAFDKNIGVELSLNNVLEEENLSIEEFIFAEAPTRYVVEISQSKLEYIKENLKKDDDYKILGKTISTPEIRIDDEISIDLKELRESWSKAISRFMEE
ncbi:MAG: phosphoribosylformylglycinamidine synthase subunit PurL [Candidatus Heimdallarchaeota archaeon]|nr:phosphoribosylformylglycinamidine synthase subunit PurL [Candidatus Heimdallarchaeota archaeon]